jgi:para-aminobenzoate synthetase component I
LGGWEVSVWCDATGRRTVAVGRDGRTIREWDDPLAALDWVERFDLRDYPWGEPRWVGYLSYDLGRWFESVPAVVRDDLTLPMFAFVLGHARAGTAPPQPVSRMGGHSLPRVRSTFSRDGYIRAVARAIEYVGAGDVFQVNLSQRFTAAAGLWPDRVFRRLAAAGGAHYGCLLHFGDFALVCNSPELFFRVTPDPTTGKRRVVTRPIKGTRPRSPGMDAELRDSVKDQAELNMIVDLERNDLGRVCEVGSVRVTEPRTIEAHPTVYHGVATVEGVLRDDVGFVDLLRATFPGGSVTGAPKIRAMEIIEELEPVRRGPYCGAIGYLAADGHMEFNVAIRTIIVKDGLAHVPVGGGIVADSDPAAEYEETLVKARAMFAALGVSADDVR